MGCSEKFKSCVKKVKQKGKNVNPYAVCHASVDKSFDDYMESYLTKGGPGSGRHAELLHQAQQERQRLMSLGNGATIHKRNNLVTRIDGFSKMIEDGKHEHVPSLEKVLNESKLVQKAIIPHKGTGHMTDSNSQALAKLSTPENFQVFITGFVKDLGPGEIANIPLTDDKTAKIYKIEDGIYSGTIIDNKDGAIIHNIDRVSIPEIAAHIISKDIVPEPIVEQTPIAEEKSEVVENENKQIVININIQKSKEGEEKMDKLDMLIKGFLGKNDKKKKPEDDKKVEIAPEIKTQLKEEGKETPVYKPEIKAEAEDKEDPKHEAQETSEQEAKEQATGQEDEVKSEEKEEQIKNLDEVQTDEEKPEPDAKQALIMDIMKMIKKHHLEGNKEITKDLSKFLAYLHKDMDQQLQNIEQTQEEVAKKEDPTAKDKAEGNTEKVIHDDSRMWEKPIKKSFDDMMENFLNKGKQPLSTKPSLAALQGDTKAQQNKQAKQIAKETGNKEMLSKLKAMSSRPKVQKSFDDVVMENEKLEKSNDGFKKLEKGKNPIVSTWISKKEKATAPVEKTKTIKKSIPEYNPEAPKTVFGLGKSSPKALNILEKGNNFHSQPLVNWTGNEDLYSTIKEFEIEQLVKGKIEKRTDKEIRKAIEEKIKK